MTAGIITDFAFSTICDSDYFQFFPAFLNRLGNSPTYLYGLSLTDSQKDFCDSKSNVILRELESEDLLVGEEQYQWQLWNKPLAIPLDGTHRRIVYLDIDCVVIGDVTPLLDNINDAPQFFVGTDVGSNNPWLYDVLPVPSDQPQEFSLNNGVMGLDIERDGDFIRAWRSLTRQLYARDDFEMVGGYVHYFDEGLLRVALMQYRMTHLISDDTRYNHIVGETEVNPLSGPRILHFAGLSGKELLTQFNAEA